MYKMNIKGIDTLRSLVMDTIKKYPKKKANSVILKISYMAFMLGLNEEELKEI